MNMKIISLSSIFLIIVISSTLATRPDSFGPFSADLNHSPNKAKQPGGGGNDGGFGGMYGPGNGFGIPGFGQGWGNGIIGGGYGSGYGGPTGGYSRNGVIRPSVVCKEKGPCYNKKLTCPAKCFTSYSRSGKGYGGGGGGGGCTMDCKKKCVAYC
ncbi:glycine-rich cell wall structural protein 2-like [Carica papaya]|uniref:glycine-rich cell wall structural protein 2-like n=1 Tax=Carica papaya TaxID=3649 RepID=UPI000B8CE63F|nr:glycine-rich cell wall structural protein 2-like [Carica papaya]